MATQKLALKALDLMTTSDVAKELGVTIRSVQLWVEQGALEGWKTPGGHRRITRASFNRMTASRTSQKKSLPNDNSKLQVLIIENDEATQSLYRQTIKTWGLPVDVKIMVNACDALIAVSLQAPDLLMTDLSLSEIDGLCMLKALRKNDAFSDMDIVAVTNLSADDISARGSLPKRVRLYSKNPIPFWEMKELMAGLIERKQERVS
ncbi:MAG: response regulator [Methylotenera sp.]|nr:response regulator [Methylotenera sp.]